MNDDKDMYIVGKVLSTHGIKGEVKVKKITHFDDRFNVGATVYIEKEGSSYEILTIESCRSHQQNLLLRFSEYGTIDAAKTLVGRYLKISEAQLTNLASGEYYYYEVIGCDVYSTDGLFIGTVQSILAPGANDVFVTKDSKGKEYLIPNISLVIKDINVQEKRITIELMEGLLD